MTSPTPRRRIVRLLGPLAVSAVLLLAIEMALRGLGFETDISAGGDPKANQSLLFRPSTRDGVAIMERPGSPVAFARSKPAGGLRVFVIGESSVWGFPYGPQLAFSQFLQHHLSAAWPQRTIEVTNCGIPAIGSWHARRVVDEITHYEPDIVVIYTGHNDWILPGPEAVTGATRWLARLRLYQLTVAARETWRRWRHGPIDVAQLNTPTEPYGYARERARGRSTMTARDRAGVAARYRDNLRAMVRAARAAGASVIVAGLAQNFSDFPPGASRHRPGLRADQRAGWKALVETADALARAGDCRGALERLDAARRIDRRPALLHFARARCLERLGRFANARAAYRLASDLDEVPLGAPTTFNEVIRQVAAEMHVPYVDIAAGLERASPHGMVGSDFFIDHLHPNVAGHAAIAREIAAAMGAHPAAAGADPVPTSGADSDLERRIVFAKIPLYLVLGWYDAAAQEARDASHRYPDIQLDGVIEQLRRSDPIPPWSEPVDAPD